MPEPSTINRPRPAAPAQSASSGNASEEAKTTPMEADATRDPAALTQRLEEIQSEPDSREWPGMLLDLMHEASMAEVQALLAASDGELGSSPGFRDEMKAAAYERWYHLDPVGALRAIDGATMSPRRKASVMATLLEDWSRRSPDQVSAFLLEGGLTGVSSDQIYGAIVRGSAISGAVDLVQSSISRIQDPKLRSYALREAARAFQRDHEALFDAWVGTLPSEDQATALAEGAWMLVDKDPNLALERLDQLEKLGADQLPVTRSRIVVKWSRQDPGNAGQWVLDQKLPEAERENLLSLVFKVWISKDRDAAAAWAEDSINRGTMDEALMNRVATRLQP